MISSFQTVLSTATCATTQWERAQLRRYENQDCLRLVPSHKRPAVEAETEVAEVAEVSVVEAEALTSAEGC